MRFLKLGLFSILVFFLLIVNVSSYVVLSPSAWRPTDIAGCVLWLRSDLGITKNGSDLVSEWVDQSGSGNNISAAGNARPTWIDNQLNHHAVVSFDGVNNYMDFSGTKTVSNFSLFYVGSVPDTQVFVLAMHDLSSYFALNPYDIAISPDNYLIQIGLIGGATLYEQRDTGLLGYLIASHVRDTTNFKSYLNSVNKVDYTNAGFVGNFSFDNWQSLNGGKGEVKCSEFIIYNSALSDSNRYLVESYLNARYAVFSIFFISWNAIPLILSFNIIIVILAKKKRFGMKIIGRSS